MTQQPPACVHACCCAHTVIPASVASPSLRICNVGSYILYLSFETRRDKTRQGPPLLTGRSLGSTKASHTPPRWVSDALALKRTTKHIARRDGLVRSCAAATAKPGQPSAESRRRRALRGGLGSRASICADGAGMRVKVCRASPTPHDLKHALLEAQRPVLSPNPAA